MAGSAMVTGVIGGHLSDRVGRRPMMLIGRGFFCLTSLGALAAGTDTLAGLSVIAATGALSSLGDAADTAMVADLVAPDDREQAYASLRVAANMGVVLGPPIGGLLLAGSWNTLFVGAACLSAISWALAWRLIPSRGRFTPERGEKSERISVVFRDRPFMTLLGGAVLAWMVYVGFELLLPISIVEHHGVNRSVWGAIAIVNPLLVALLQMRVTSSSARFSPATRMVASMMLMGLPFLVFGVSDALPIVVAAVVVFVFGEMLWVPTMLAVVADRAPPAQRGAYMGAFSATSGAAFALTPLVGLQVLGRAGDQAMWALIATIAVIGAAAFATVLRH